MSTSEIIINFRTGTNLDVDVITIVRALALQQSLPNRVDNLLLKFVEGIVNTNHSSLSICALQSLTLRFS